MDPRKSPQFTPRKADFEAFSDVHLRAINQFRRAARRGCRPLLDLTASACWPPAMTRSGLASCRLSFSVRSFCKGVDFVAEQTVCAGRASASNRKTGLPGDATADCRAVVGAAGLKRGPQSHDHRDHHCPGKRGKTGDREDRDGGRSATHSSAGMYLMDYGHPDLGANTCRIPTFDTIGPKPFPNT